MKLELDEFLRKEPENTEVARKADPQKSLEWYLRSRPTAGFRAAEGDRSDWSGSSARCQNWAGWRER